MDPSDTSLDFTGQIEGGTGGVAANDEGYFGSGWDPEGTLILPGGDDAYTPGGPEGLMSDPNMRLGDDYDPPPPPDNDDDGDGQDPGDMSGDEHTRFIMGLRDIPVGAERAIEAYIVEHLGEGWELNPGVDEPCVGEYSLPWSDVDEDCFQPDGLEDREATIRGEELEELCGIPCIYDRDFPTLDEAEDATAFIDIRGNGDPEMESLVECAWALLLENKDLIDFIVCTITRNPDAGECILEKITSFDAKVFIEDCGSREANAWADVVLVEDVLLAVLVFLFAPVLALFVITETMHLHICADKLEDLRDDWSAGGDCADCACILMATIIFHEVAHLCLRDLLDKDECGFADMVQGSFALMVQERYGPLTCCDFSDNWWTDVI